MSFKATACFVTSKLVVDGFSYMSLERHAVRKAHWLYVRQCIVLYLVPVLGGWDSQTSDRFIGSALFYPPQQKTPYCILTFDTFVYFFHLCVYKNLTWALSRAMSLCLQLPLRFPWDYTRYWDYPSQSRITWTKSSVTNVCVEACVCLGECGYT